MAGAIKHVSQQTVQKLKNPQTISMAKQTVTAIGDDFIRSSGFQRTQNLVGKTLKVVGQVVMSIARIIWNRLPQGLRQRSQDFFHQHVSRLAQATATASKHVGDEFTRVTHDGLQSMGNHLSTAVKDTSRSVSSSAQHTGKYLNTSLKKNTSWPTHLNKVHEALAGRMTRKDLPKIKGRFRSRKLFDLQSRLKHRKKVYEALRPEDRQDIAKVMLGQFKSSQLTENAKLYLQDVNRFSHFMGVHPKEFAELYGKSSRAFLRENPLGIKLTSSGNVNIQNVKELTQAFARMFKREGAGRRLVPNSTTMNKITHRPSGKEIDYQTLSKAELVPEKLLERAMNTVDAIVFRHGKHMPDFANRIL